MPALKNPKHEAFAQARAVGKSQTEAYSIAGYKPSEHHASRLARNGKVAARIAELTEKAAAKAVVTIETIAAQLDEDRDLARRLDQPSAAVTASMGKAKLFGLLVEKAEVSVTHRFEDLADEELDREIISLAGETRQIAKH